MKIFLLFIFSTVSVLSLNGQKTKDKLNLKTAEDSMIYSIGILYFEAIKSELIEKFNVEINTETFIRGIKDNSDGNPGFSRDEANAIVSAFLAEKEIETVRTEKETGDKFLAENRKRDGVFVTESGLQYEIITPGSGRKPIPGDQVKVHYTGNLIDGSKFDSSIDRGEPVEFGLDEVISGWREGLQLMPEGSRFRFYLPSELGYGKNGAGEIKPNSVLVFDIELLDILN